MEIVIVSFEAEKVMSFEVPGKPLPFCRAGRGDRRQNYFNTRRYREYVQGIRLLARDALEDKRRYPDVKARFAVLIEVDTVRNSDVDNIEKPILDALQGVVYNKDSQVDKLWIERWAVGRETVRQRSKITVYRMSSAATKRKKI